MRGRLLLLILAASIGGFAYYSNWFHKVDAAIRFGAPYVTIYPRDHDYNNCTVRITGDYKCNIDRIPYGQPYSIELHKFQQWNGTVLESTDQLQGKISVSIWCDEGRQSASFQLR